MFNVLIIKINPVFIGLSEVSIDSYKMYLINFLWLSAFRYEIFPNSSTKRDFVGASSRNSFSNLVKSDCTFPLMDLSVEELIVSSRSKAYFEYIFSTLFPGSLLTT